MTVKKLKEYAGNLPEEIEDPGGVIYDLINMICALPKEPETPTENQDELWIEAYKELHKRLGFGFNAADYINWMKQSYSITPK